MDKIEHRCTALDDAPRLDAVQIRGDKQIGRPEGRLTVISGGNKICKTDKRTCSG
jgi:hypothetical protein